ncbi:RuvC-like resolvase [Mycobacterium phage Indlulamithi]|uniref:RuvC-like resolvase n=1 Tax=Mycobacterium phage Indlulamithi TaxID=2656582 RepID=A0A649VCN9_9CAUD|nr:RuvC-like resolvase [Mycobacterium phage Indlulamithi]QGJ90120.1 RuvC-like resolvase [Mycobacterium phage Indlulamithi]
MSYLGPKPHSLAGGKELRESTMPGPCLPLIALDPGGMTGWSLIVLPANIFDQKLPLDQLLQRKSLWVHGQTECYDVNHGAHILRKYLIDQWPTAALVFETFFLRGNTKSVDLTPVELNAILGHHLWIKKRDRHWQQPAMAKRLDNDRLKLMNVYTSEGGMQHARDADRHALMMIRRCMEGKGMKERLWPHVYQTG